MKNQLAKTLLLILLMTTQHSFALERIPIIIDTDANNELDDQHALAYAFFNQDVFDIKGITVNHTAVGSINDDFEEAKRVMQLSGVWGEFPLIEGVDNGTYEKICDHLKMPEHEGHQAIDFIIQQAHSQGDERLVIAPIGKLTNVALALEKDPSIVDKVKIVWLGGNYDGQDGYDGEHNLMHDASAYNSIILSGADFTMVTVRYGKPTGSAAVSVDVDEIQRIMAGLGPKTAPVLGRNGGFFSTFGDYSVDLFSDTSRSSRSLFDLVVFAVLKNPRWGESSLIDAPRLEGDSWNGKFEGLKIRLVENFNKSEILTDFYESIRSPAP